jgi:hypothetical protein
MFVIGGGCHDCHTPMKPGPNGAEPDMSKMLSGHPESITITAPMKPVGPWVVATNATNTAWSGPWGVSFAANLTPDKETGLNMTERNFVIALKTGAHLGTARPVLPPMPWPWYGQLGEDALKDIYAYLLTVPALKNQVPAPIPLPESRAGRVQRHRRPPSAPVDRRGGAFTAPRPPQRGRAITPSGPRSEPDIGVASLAGAQGAARRGERFQGRLRLSVRRSRRRQRHHVRPPRCRRCPLITNRSTTTMEPAWRRPTWTATA